MAAVAQARAAAEAQLAAARALPAAYLRAVFASAEAQGWRIRQLGEVSTLLPSRSIAVSGDTNVQAITTACLTESGFDPSGTKPARMWAKDAAECVVSPGEVLIARSNTSKLVGRVSMFPGEPKGVVASDLTIRIWPGSEIDSSFLAAYLSFLYLSGYWKERAGGASDSMKKITRTQIQEKALPVPPISEQRRVVNWLATKMIGANQTRQAVEVQLAAINELPVALLRQAFRGEL